MTNGAFRRKKVSFTQVSNHILKDPNISTSAKGLYAIINCYINIPDFVLYKSFLLKTCKEKETAFERMWKELKTFGYLKQYKIKDSTTGRFIYEYDLLDIPEIDSPEGDFLGGGKPTSGKSMGWKKGVYNNNDFNNNDSNNNNNNNRVDSKNGNSANRKNQKTNKKEYDSTVIEYKQRIDKALNCNEVSENTIETLLQSKNGKENMEYVIENWCSFNCTSNKGGFFRSAVENGWKVSKQANTLANMQNFEQRNVDSDYYAEIENRFSNSIQ